MLLSLAAVLGLVWAGLKRPVCYSVLRICHTRQGNSRYTTMKQIRPRRCFCDSSSSSCRHAAWLSIVRCCMLIFTVAHKYLLIFTTTSWYALQFLLACAQEVIITAMESMPIAKMRTCWMRTWLILSENIAKRFHPINEMMPKLVHLFDFRDKKRMRS